MDDQAERLREKVKTLESIREQKRLPLLVEKVE